MNHPTSDIFAEIQAARPHLNPTLQRVAGTVIERANDLRAMSIRDLAHVCDVSQSSMSRFVHAVDSRNFRMSRIRVAGDVTRSYSRESLYESMVSKLGQLLVIGAPYALIARSRKQ